MEIGSLVGLKVESLGRIVEGKNGDVFEFYEINTATSRMYLFFIILTGLNDRVIGRSALEE